MSDNSTKTPSTNPRFSLRRSTPRNMSTDFTMPHYIPECPSQSQPHHYFAASPSPSTNPFLTPSAVPTQFYTNNSGYFGEAYNNVQLYPSEQDLAMFGYHPTVPHSPMTIDPAPYLEMDMEDWNTDINPLHAQFPCQQPSYEHNVPNRYSDEPEQQRRFIHPTDVSPLVSPISEYPPQGCDPRFVSGTYDERCAVRIGRCAEEQDRYESDRDGVVENEEADAEGEDVDDYGADNGSHLDLDFELDGDDDDGDEEFVLRTRRSTSGIEGRGLRLRSGRTARYNPYTTSPTNSHLSLTRTRRISTGSVSSSSSSLPTLSHSPSPTSPGSPGTPTRRRTRPCTTIPVPIPVPNLTKKSRGRRVPTAASLGHAESARSSGKHHVEFDEGLRDSAEPGGKGSRMYMCKVAGCGKCFARGEHLKRHVRSIHTYEKPHKCPYPGCGKDFSRHDNLGQHMRVHKDYAMPKEGLGSLNGYRV